MKSLKTAFVLFMSFVLVTVIASFAWFYSNQEVDLSNKNDMNVTVGQQIRVALVENGVETTEYGSKVSAPVSNNGYLADCSGDGETFYTPTSLDINDVPVSLKLIDDEKEKYLIEYRIRLKTSNKIDIFLGNGSYVRPDQETLESNKSIYGNFSANYIAGCARVAFLEVKEDESTELKYVWAPNPGYYIYDIDGVYFFEENNTSVSQTYGYLLPKTDEELAVNDTPSYKQVNYTDDDFANRKILPYNPTSFANQDYNTTNLSPLLCSFEQEGIMQTRDIIIRVWFEGTDRESNSVFNQGMVEYNFNFVGLQKQKNDGALLDHIKYDSENEKLYYYNTEDETDPNNDVNYNGTGETSDTNILNGNIIVSHNGRYWVTYTDGCLEKDNYLKNSRKIYVRTMETIEKYTSDKCVKITK